MLQKKLAKHVVLMVLWQKMLEKKLPTKASKKCSSDGVFAQKIAKQMCQKNVVLMVLWRAPSGHWSAVAAWELHRRAPASHRHYTTN